MPYKDPARQRQFQRERNAQVRAEWFQRNGPCIKCGSDHRLEADHIDPTKKLSHRIWSWSKPRREAELSKCQVLCRACHEKKTNDPIRAARVHGETTVLYALGCRCQPCKDRMARKQARWRWRVRLLNVLHQHIRSRSGSGDAT